MFDWLPFPGLLATRKCVFLHANAAGKRLLDAQDPLTLVDGHLEVAGAGHGLSLVRLLRGSQGDVPGNSAIALPRRACDFPLLLSLRCVNLETVQRQGVALPEEISANEPLILFLALNDGSPAARIAENRGLSQAEEAILRALLFGETVQQIARKRSVSLNTVQAQVRHILAKLGLSSLNQLVLWARAWH